MRATSPFTGRRWLALCTVWSFTTGCVQRGDDPQFGSHTAALTSNALLIPAPGQTTHARVPATADTSVAQWEPNRSSGESALLHVHGLARRRALVDFDLAAVRAAIGGEKLARAELSLTIAARSLPAIPGAISAHALTRDFGERGATWACADDRVPNAALDCAADDRWSMTRAGGAPLAYREPASATTRVHAFQRGELRLDVTTDLACALAGYRPLHGYLIKQVLEALPGRVDFASRESSTPPALLLHLRPTGGVSATAAQCGAPEPDAGTPDASTCQPSASTDSSCDGVDDDCDGVIDDDYRSAPTQCGVGACQASGQRSCVAGREVDDCLPLSAAATDATCDGVDDNCNGVPDEQYTPECSGASLTGCSQGQLVYTACDDHDACTADGCSLGACTFAARSCDDGVFCNGAEGCDPGRGCTAGSPPGLDDRVDCTADVCDEASASVLHLPSDAACADADVCNGQERCDLALGCSAGTPLVMDDGNACTVDACDPVGGVRHLDAPVGTACGAGAYCLDGARCTRFPQCAGPNPLTLAGGQNLTFDGPCEIGSIVFSGGSLTVRGALKTGAVSLTSGGSLKVTGGALLSGAITLSNGSIDLGGDVYASLTQSGGSFASGGTFAPGAGGFTLLGGTFTNSGRLRLPVFDASNVRGGLLVNRGRLDVDSGSITLVSGAALSESGSLGEQDSIAQLSVSGSLLHEPRLAPGLAFKVTGDAVIAATGRIDVSGRGLAGFSGPGNSGAGQGYVWTGTQWIVSNGVGRSSTGGSHGGVGAGEANQLAAPANDSLGAPELLGSGGGGADVGNGYVGGHGGGRVDLVVGGTLTLQGAILANGNSALAHCGGGSGGSVRLRVGSFAGSGSIAADGGAASGGGGGGRIAITYDTTSFTGSVRAAGAALAGAGTVYLKRSESALGELVLDNAGRVSSPTPLTASDGPFARVSVLGNASASASATLTEQWLVDGGRLTLAGDANGGSFRLGAGTLELSGHVLPASLVLSGSGVLNNLGTLELAAGGLQLNGGTLNNLGTVRLPVFDASNVRGGTFVNSGRLDVDSDAISIVAGAALSETGTLGASDSIGSLLVSGTLLHETHAQGGLAFTVTGDATVTASGRIDVSGRGLLGYNGGSTGNAGGGENYVWDGVRYVISSAGGTRAGGTHGGVGVGGATPVPINDDPSAPVLLGGGGGGPDVSNGYRGGNGGGRVDLVVNGTLRVDGVITAAGASAPSIAGAGAGGSIRLSVNRLVGGGAILASGGSSFNSGGGGRIALEYRAKTFTGSVQAVGGSGAAAGSVSDRNLTSNPRSASADVQAAAAQLCQLSSVGLLDCAGSDEARVVSRAPATAYQRLALGSRYACALHAAGIAHCWGEVASGLHDTPTDAFSDIAVSRFAACGVRASNGSLVCWGLDTDGILSGKPSGAFSAIYMAERSACGKRGNGTLQCWGDDSAHAVSQAPSAPLLAVDGGDGFFCGLTGDHGLLCWGDGVTAAPTSGTYASISSGSAHACALDAAGEAVCWGRDSAGQTDAIAGPWARLATAAAFSCGEDAAGHLTCWGDTPIDL